MGPRASLKGCRNCCPPPSPSPDRLVLSEYLYRLSYPGQHIYTYLSPLVDARLTELFVIITGLKKELGLSLHQNNSLLFMETDGTYLFHNSLPFVLFLSQWKTFHSRAHCKYLSNLRSNLSGRFYPTDFQNKILYKFVSPSSMWHICSFYSLICICFTKLVYTILLEKVTWI